MPHWAPAIAPPRERCKADTDWHKPVELNMAKSLAFPGEALAMRQLFNKQLWSFFLGEKWGMEPKAEGSSSDSDD